MTEAMFFTIGRSRISGQQILGLRPNTEADSTKNCDSIIFDLNVNVLLQLPQENDFPCMIFSWIYTACDCASFLLQLTQENIFLFHEIFHGTSVVVIVQSFVTIATRECFSIAWSISWIYTTCNCPSFLLQLP